MLTLIEAIKKVPAIGQTSSDEKFTSSKYQFQSTKHIIVEFMKQDWEIVNVKGSTIKGITTHGYHQIEMRKEGLVVPGTKDEYRIYVSNSHDGSRAFSVSLGIHRLVCSNGLVVFVKEAGKTSVKHIGNNFKEIVDNAISEIYGHMTKIQEQVDFWTTHKLNEQQKFNLAFDMLSIRLGNNKVPTKLQVQEVLASSRKEDDYDFIWTVFNRVQENIIKGNYHYKSNVKGKSVMKKASELKNAEYLLKANIQFWQCCSDVVSDIKRKSSIIEITSKDVINVEIEEKIELLALEAK